MLGKRVVFEDPRTNQREEVVSRQRVLDIPLRVVVADTRKAIRDLNLRGPKEIGHIVRDRFVMQNEPVFARTRIPVATVKRYLEAVFGEDEIIREYPDLTPGDIAAARSFDGRIAA